TGLYAAAYPRLGAQFATGAHDRWKKLMTSQLEAVGRMKMALDTPVLLVDLAVMEGNIRQIAAICRNAKVAWRPHTKGIKIPAIAHEALAAGAIGVTCAKL